MRRHAAIRELVRHRHIGSQDELLDALAERGFELTQSTLSRDLRDLQIGRVPSADGYRYVDVDDDPATAAETPETHRLLRSIAPLEVTGVTANEVLVVVRTLPGRAQGVAALIDRLDLEEILATIAGDDTVLVVPVSSARAGALKSTLDGLLGSSA